jgi:flavin-dependent dehydrogenase
VAASRLAEARRITPVHVLSDFSYRAARSAGDGWALIGDAFGFLDPIYSSGVLLAFKSAEMAAECIDEGLRRGDLSAEQLGRFGPDMARGMEAIRNLVYAFYTPGFSFANFIREHPEHRDRIIEILVGAVFQGEVAGLFEDLKKFCDLPEPVPLDAGPGIASRGR